MKFWEYGILWFIGLAIGVALLQVLAVPGYMDADYYYLGGMQIASGKGLTEPILWNYLDSPTGLPHPSFTYWMPLAALLTAAGLTITHHMDFISARLLFLPLAAAVPVVTAWLTWRLSGRRILAWIAGGLALCSGFYAVYLGLTETFTLFMLLGALFLVTATSRLGSAQKAFALGGLAGCMHLTRADGVLWMAGGLIYLGYEVWSHRRQSSWWVKLGSLGIFLATYGVVMSFWFVRNVEQFGGLFPPGTSRTLWLLNYDQLYNFPASSLTMQNWLAAGLPALLKLRWDALLANLQTLVAVQGEVFLFPLILVGAWRLRRERVVQIGLLGWLATLVVMTVVFPLAGSRGGFLHSGAAFQPLFWALAVEGLAGFIGLGIRWRHWKWQRASLGFGLIAVMIAGVMTLGIAVGQVSGNEDGKGGWVSSWQAYNRVGLEMDRLAIPEGTPVLVNNPPGFTVATGRPAIAIPNGDIQTLLSAASTFHAGYLVLEENTVEGLRGLYAQPADQPGLRYITAVGQAQVFQVLAP